MQAEIPTVLLLVSLVAAVAIAAAVSLVVLGIAFARQQGAMRAIAEEQHDALMAFHAAGRSLAAHEIEQLRINLAIKQAEAEKSGIDLRMREMDRLPKPVVDEPGRRGRFGSNGVVVGPHDIDGT